MNNNNITFLNKKSIQYYNNKLEKKAINLELNFENIIQLGN